MAGCGGRGAPLRASAPDSIPPLVPPLDSITVTATLGEFRTAHFHAGLDFSTHGETGHAVYAPLAGSIVRLRASGGGYGRSVFIRDARGHSILFGHLDAFDEPLASVLDSAQRADGQFEQDLLLPPGRIVVRAGQRIAWSGSSGAGPPHLHMELRRGDTSLNPLRFGMALPDTIPPLLERLFLEPLDSSLVARRPFVKSVWLGGRVDTLVVVGRVRPWIEAEDPGVSGAHMAPYVIATEWNGARVEARIDSLVWDPDMVAAEWVYDAGARVGRLHPLALWFGPEFHTLIYAEPARAREAGVIEVKAGDPARPLAIEARDVAGNVRQATVWIRGPRAGEERAPGVARRVLARGAAPAETMMVSPARAASLAVGGFAWQLPRDGVFATTRYAVAPPGSPARMAGLRPVSDAWSVSPGDLPLRRAARVSIARAAGADVRRTGIYVVEGRAFRAVATGTDSAGRTWGETRAVGSYALYEDDSPPAIGRRHAHLLPGASVPYSRWALEASIVDRGSGLDVRGTHFIVDGRQVPSEYDVDMSLLRWRPNPRPAPGRHTYEVVATDRAGNVSRATGGFVIR